MRSMSPRRAGQGRWSLHCRKRCRSTPSACPTSPGRLSPAFPDPAALKTMRDMIGKSKRPVAVVGGSCWTDAGRAALGRFLVQNDIPVTVGFRRQAHYDGAQANFAGDLGLDRIQAWSGRSRKPT